MMRPAIPMPDCFRKTTLIDDAVREQMGLAPQRVLPTYGGQARDPHDERQDRFDRELVRRGIMTEESYHRARHVGKHDNVLRMLHMDAAAETLFGVTYTSNLRTNAGTTWLGYALNGGGAGTASGFGLHTSFTAASVSGLIVTGPSGFAPSAGQYIGHILTMGASYGYIVAHGTGASATATVDRWYDTTVTTGAAGSTPAAGQVLILPGQGPAFWMALTNDSATPNTTDTSLASEITTNGLLRTRATIAFTPPSSSGTSTNQGTFTEQVTFISNTGAVSFQKAGVLTAQNGGILVWAAPLSPTTLQGVSADQAQVTWTMNF